jgi:hypothetical protein
MNIAEQLVVRMTALIESMWGTDLSAAAAQAEQLDAEFHESLDKRRSGAMGNHRTGAQGD